MAGTDIHTSTQTDRQTYRQTDTQSDTLPSLRVLKLCRALKNIIDRIHIMNLYSPILQAAASSSAVWRPAGGMSVMNCGLSCSFTLQLFIQINAELKKILMMTISSLLMFEYDLTSINFIST